MSTLKTNNIEHLDGSSPSVKTTIGGGTIITGVSTFQSDANFDGNVNIAGTITYEDVSSVDSVGVITAQSDVVIADKIIHLGDTDTAIRFPSNNTFSVETGGSERLRVRSNGVVAIGTHESTTINFAAAKTQIFNTGDRLLSLMYGEANSSGPQLNFAKGRDGDNSASTAVSNNDLLGSIHFAGADGSDFNSVGAEIAVNVDAAPGSDNMPGRIVFKTTASGASTSTERMRIDSAGKIGIGTDFQSSYALLEVEGSNLYTGSASNLETSVTKSAFRVKGSTNSSDSLWIGVENANAQPYIQGANGTGSNAKDITLNPYGGFVGIGTDDPTERLHVDSHSDGQVALLRASSASFAEVQLIAGADVSDRIRLRGDTSNNFRIYNGDSEAMRFDTDGKLFLERITGNAVGGSTVKYNNSDKELRYDTSSRLLKTNITECTYGIETIKKLKPSRYNPQEYDKEGNITVIDQYCIGFIADEMVEDVPEVVHMYPKSSLTKNVEDTELVPAAISYDKLTPVLTKALQEAITKIETLETSNADLLARVTALEGN
jgi:hypothetical protein|tara:strand:+ start:309 stop:1949 length:1641 start_codon:yes stop_codon:yes gene_type:complete